MKLFLFIFVTYVISPIILGYFCLFFPLSKRSKYLILIFYLKQPLKIFNIKIDIEDRRKSNELNNKNILIVSNHVSSFDIICLILAFKFPLSFVVKKELYKIPWLNIWFRVLECISIDRTNIRETYLKTVIKTSEMLKKGNKVVLFPSGTRSRTWVNFKPGSLKSAFYAKANILPVSLKYTGDFSTKGLFNVFDRKIIKVVINNQISYNCYSQMNTISLCDSITKVIIKDL